MKQELQVLNYLHVQSKYLQLYKCNLFLYTTRCLLTPLRFTFLTADLIETTFFKIPQL